MHHDKRGWNNTSSSRQWRSIGALSIWVRPALARRAEWSDGQNVGRTVQEKLNSTIKNIKNENVIKTLSRINLYLSQTPQVFKTSSLVKGYNNIKKINKFTDESEMLEKNGFKIPIKYSIR